MAMIRQRKLVFPLPCVRWILNCISNLVREIMRSLSILLVTLSLFAPLAVLAAPVNPENPASTGKLPHFLKRRWGIKPSKPKPQGSGICKVDPDLHKPGYVTDCIKHPAMSGFRRNGINDCLNKEETEKTYQGEDYGTCYYSNNMLVLDPKTGRLLSVTKH